MNKMDGNICEIKHLRMINRRVELVGIKQFKITEREIPTAPPGGFVVRVTHSGICHSDMSLSQYLMHPHFEFPIVLGHEISGVIHEKGILASEEFLLGDQVIVYPWGNCSECSFCLNDYPFCSNKTSTVEFKYTYKYGVWRDGGFQNFIVVHLPQFLQKIPQGIPLAEAALVPCCGVTAFSAVESLRESVERAVQVNGRATIGIIGAGGLALWAIQIAKVIFPNDMDIVVMDINNVKLVDALAQGADKSHLWGTSESVQEAKNNYYNVNKQSLDGVIDFVGCDQTQQRAFALLSVGGTMSIVGFGEEFISRLPIKSIIMKNLTIRGIVTGSKGQCVQLMEWMSSGKVKSPKIEEVQLDDVVNVIQKLKEGTQRGRAVIKM